MTLLNRTGKSVGQKKRDSLFTVRRRNANDNKQRSNWKKAISSAVRAADS